MYRKPSYRSLKEKIFVPYRDLPYKKDDFTRRGELQGTVRVSFISPVDEREYAVVRNTKNTYYVHDPRAKIKVVEQKEDVMKWLRHQFGVEESVDLPYLFETVLGVPQGTFTVDFQKAIESGFGF